MKRVMIRELSSTLVELVYPEGHKLNPDAAGKRCRYLYWQNVSGGAVYSGTSGGVRYAFQVCEMLDIRGNTLAPEKDERLIDVIRHEYRRLYRYQKK